MCGNSSQIYRLLNVNGYLVGITLLKEEEGERPFFEKQYRKYLVSADNLINGPVFLIVSVQMAKKLLKKICSYYSIVFVIIILFIK